MEILSVILLSVVSLSVLFLISKVTGHRQIGQMSMFDYINSITIGSIAAEFATGLENWQRPLTAMLVFGILTMLINWITCKSLPLRRFFSGKPLILMENGCIYKQSLSKASVDINEFLTKCRVAGYQDLNQLQTVILETNGQFSFFPKSQNRPVTPADLQLHPQEEALWVSLILDGKVLQENLQAGGWDTQWLQSKLHSQNIGQISEVFFAAADGKDGFFACRKSRQPSQRELFE